MKNGIKLLTVMIVSFFASFMVANAATFTVAYCSENNYIRQSAGSNIKLTDVDKQTIILPTDHRVEILEEVTSGGSKWYKIYTNYYSNNYIGYIYSGYFKNKKTYTLDEGYISTLRNKGFPNSYVMPLAKLHALYPSWNFEPVLRNGAGIDWNTALNGEMEVLSRNLINSSTDTSLWSTEGEAYQNGVYKAYDNGSWRAASRQTVGFYMDPRNWFFERTVFMFEQLTYNATMHKESTVKSMLNNTFMSGSYAYNGGTKTYSSTFVEVGQNTNISPLHLAGRVLQEQSTQGSATINMNGGDGQTYHNYFNIGATGNSSSEIIAHALATAKSNRWTNPYLSILGGAKTLSNGYIGDGQDTIYLEKFNVVNGVYWHQYQQNVRVATTESSSAYVAYKNANVLSSGFTFKIPVFANMPEETSLAITKNGDNTLKTLSIDKCNLTPSFNSATTSYSCLVENTVTSVNVSASPATSYSTVKGTGNVALTSDVTNVNVYVTAANGNQKTYTITITKVVPSTANPSDIISTLALNNNANYISGFKLGVTRKEFINNITGKYPLATVVYKQANGVETTSGIVSTGDKFTITNGNITTTFTAVIKGDTNGDGNITVADYAKVKSHILKKLTLIDAYSKAADVNKDNQISVADYAKIKSHILKKLTIEQ